MLTDTFKYSFFPFASNKWNKLGLDIGNSTYSTFRKILLKKICSLPNPTYYVFNPLGLKLLTRLRLGSSHLNEHSFNHNFKKYINSLYTCSPAVESTLHFFLRFQIYNSARASLLNELNYIDGNSTQLLEIYILNLLPYGSPEFNESQNKVILNTTITFIISLDRFSGPLI